MHGQNEVSRLCIFEHFWKHVWNHFPSWLKSITRLKWASELRLLTWEWSYGQFQFTRLEKLTPRSSDWYRIAADMVSSTVFDTVKKLNSICVDQLMKFEIIPKWKCSTQLYTKKAISRKATRIIRCFAREFNLRINVCMDGKIWINVINRSISWFVFCVCFY